LVRLGKEAVNIELLADVDLIKNSTKKVKVFKDTEECIKMDLSGIYVTASVKEMIEKAGGSVQV
jgi:ribosomal protein L15